MASGPHILREFDEALQSLRNDILLMASLAERGLDNAMRCLLRAERDCCNMAIADDEELDILDKTIAAKGTEVLMRFQPVASDLRQVVASIRLSGNIERVGDQAVKIARRTRRLTANPPLVEIELLEEPWTNAKALFADSMRAFAEGEMELARSIRQRDRALDELNREVAQRLTSAMATSPEHIADYINLLFVGRHLERVGDHAKNIAEEAVYLHEADDIRHPENRFNEEADLTST
jgi:phosphate transport system protein